VRECWRRPGEVDYFRQLRQVHAVRSLTGAEWGEFLSQVWAGVHIGEDYATSALASVLKEASELAGGVYDCRKENSGLDRQNAVGRHVEVREPCIDPIVNLA